MHKILSFKPFPRGGSGQCFVISVRHIHVPTGTVASAAKGYHYPSVCVRDSLRAKLAHFSHVWTTVHTTLTTE